MRYRPLHRRSAAALIAACLGVALGTCRAAAADQPAMTITQLCAQVLPTYVFIGGGSGVVVSHDGLVLTNHHVIEGLGDLTVRFAGGQSRPATLLGTDPVGDIALLSITDAHDLPAVPFADGMHPGERVIAIGNPFGLGELDDIPTISQGVLSAVGLVRDNYTDALQGDAPVNPGNSGGPLFDMRGRLLGINGQIRTVTGFRINSGIGLAIASSQLAAFLPYLREAHGGYVHHTAAPSDLVLTQDAAGVLVDQPGSSRLLAGDRIIAIGGRPAVSLEVAHGLFTAAPYAPGSEIAVNVERGGTRTLVMVPVARQTIPGRAYSGLEVIENEDGMLVVDTVDPGSPAAQAGIVPGEEVVAANRRPQAHMIDWIKATMRLEPGDHLDLDVRDHGGTVQRLHMELLRQP